MVESATFDRILELVREQDVLISEHGYDEAVRDDILILDLVAGIVAAEIIEDYPSYHKGPCVLILCRDKAQDPIHALWGIPKGKTRPAVLITCYRPAPERWTDDFKKRKP
ncbi:MAG: DUF4258 domain-containing protein [Rhodomicrobiaceae bacterium]